MTKQVLARTEGVRFWGALEGSAADTQLQIGVVEVDVIKIFSRWVPVRKIISENQISFFLIDHLVNQYDII